MKRQHEMVRGPQLHNSPHISRFQIFLIVPKAASLRSELLKFYLQTL